jgi:UDP-glucuronate 4-epimerase
MKILLTGGAGFIGSNLAEVLIDRDDELILIDNFCDFYDPKIKERNTASLKQLGDFKLHRGDIRDKDFLEGLFNRYRPERVVHLAAMAGVRPSLENPGLYSDVNITGTVHLLEASRKYEVEQFVFGSSSSVYGANSKVPFQEGDALDQIVSPYAATKWAGEKLCSLYSRNEGLPTTCLRFFTVYGPRQRPEMAIHKFVRMIDSGEKIPVFHQGESARDYTFIEDILNGILASLENIKDFRIYNLGNSTTVRLIDLVQEIERALGKRAEIELMPRQKGDVPITYADISRARKELGFSPQVALPEGLARFIDWYRSGKERIEEKTTVT